VSIACPTAAAAIRFTTDGTEPTEASAEYSGPISFDVTTRVRARAFRGGLIPSDVVDGTFTRFAPGTAAHWRLDERFGASAADSSGNGRTGTVAGAAWAPGRLDHALVFDGSDDRVECGAWDVPGSAITLCAWIKLGAGFVDNDARILSKATGTQEQDHWWMLSTTTAGGERRLRARLKAGGSTTTLIASSGDLPTGVWLHAATSYDGSTLRLFLNGAEVGSAPKSGALDAGASAAVWIGANPPAAYAPFLGSIDDVRVYTTPMDAAAVNSVMNETPARPQPKVILFEPAAGAGWSLVAAGEPGHFLHLERSTTLAAADWQVIATEPLGLTPASFNDSHEFPRAFYRLRLE
jgi:hypothetical protein